HKHIERCRYTQLLITNFLLFFTEKPEKILPNNIWFFKGEEYKILGILFELLLVRHQLLPTFRYQLKQNTKNMKTSFQQKAKIGQAGSFVNQLMANNSSIPEVGKGATVLMYTDR